MQNEFITHPIHDAAEAGDLNTLTALLNEDASKIHAQTTEDDQPLHLACWQKHALAVQLLIARGAQVNSPGDHGMTPLHYAVHEGDEQSTAIVTQLLQAGADVNAKDNVLEQNPLGHAVRELHEGLDEAIRLLEDAGAQPDLEVALHRNDLVLAEKILSQDPGMSRARILAVRDFAQLHPGGEIQDSLALIGVEGLDLDMSLFGDLPADRTPFIELIDRWLGDHPV